MSNPELSAIVISFNGIEYLPRCLETLSRDLNPISHELIVVDNGSVDGSGDSVKRMYPGAVCIENSENTGFAHAVNQGIRAARGEFVYLLNQDLRFREGGTARLIKRMRADDSIGVIGPKFVGFDGKLQLSARGFPTLRHVWYDALLLSYLFRGSREFGHWRMSWFDHEREMDVDQPMGAALLLRREVVEKVGLFDESFPIFFNDVDYCKRISEAGYRAVYFPDAVVEHFVGGSTRKTPFLSTMRSHRAMAKYLYKYTAGWLVTAWGVTAIILYLGGFVRALIVKFTSSRAFFLSNESHQQ